MWHEAFGIRRQRTPYISKAARDDPLAPQSAQRATCDTSLVPHSLPPRWKGSSIHMCTTRLYSDLSRAAMTYKSGAAGRGRLRKRVRSGVRRVRHSAGWRMLAVVRAATLRAVWSMEGASQGTARRPYELAHELRDDPVEMDAIVEAASRRSADGHSPSLPTHFCPSWKGAAATVTPSCGRTLSVRGR